MDLNATLRRQDGLITRRQALAVGVTPAALEHRLRPGGPWQRVLPGTYATFTGALGERQRRRAALLHAGPTAQIAGATAARDLGLRTAPADAAVHVLVDHRVQPGSRDFVLVRRTHRLPDPWPLEGLPTSPLVRAVADTCRASSSRREVRALVAEAVQRRRTTTAALRRELAAGERAGSALLARVLAEVDDGVRSAPEAELRALLLDSPLLRHARWNPRLHLHGTWLADPDVYWADAGLVVEVDSREWHLSPDGWEATMARHARMAVAGLHVLHLPPSRIRTGSGQLVATLEAAYVAARHSGPPPGITVTSRARAA